jgi:chaperonin GroES
VPFGVALADGLRPACKEPAKPFPVSQDAPFWYNGEEMMTSLSAKVAYMDKKEKVEVESFETVEPIGKRVLIRKDEDKKETKGGIRLPDNIEIPTITGRVVSISAEIETMPEIPLRKYDKVLFNPKGAIPVDFEGDNRLFVVEVENIVAVFRKA